MFRRLGRFAALAGAVEAARRYARQNPDKVNKYANQAGRFVDQKTHGKYRNQIQGAVRKVQESTNRHPH